MGQFRDTRTAGKIEKELDEKCGTVEGAEDKQNNRMENSNKVAKKKKINHKFISNKRTCIIQSNNA